MPWIPLTRSMLDDAMRAELQRAIHEVSEEFGRLERLLPATPAGAAKASAIAQEVFDRVLPERGYRVTANYVKGGLKCTLDIETFTLLEL